MRITARSHQGLVRTNNEDAVHYDTTGGFAVLADGMGGLLAGEQASGVAVATATRLLAELQSSESTTVPQSTGERTDVLADVIEQAHRAVQAKARSLNYLGRMGTTLVIWAQHAEQAAFAHVGDSRLYVFADDHLSQVTHDHTLGQRLIDEGLAKPGAASNAGNHHVLTQAVGLAGDCQPETGAIPVCDRLLICSDGLSDLVTDEELAELIRLEDLEYCADQMVKGALDRGGRDNVSLVLVDFG